MTDRPPNLRTVAERAGVSVRTVSNVVNDYVHVAPATRAAVQRAVVELGYRPNLAARQLRMGRTGALGLVLPELASPYFSQLAALVAAEASRHGATLLVEETRGDAEREGALLRRAGTTAVDGLIVSPWGLTPEETAAAAGALPLVVLGERAATVDRVAIDNVGAMREATTHLLAAGRRRLAAVGVQPHLSNGTAALRLRGYHAAIEAAGLPREPGREIETATLHRIDGAGAVIAMLDRGLIAGRAAVDGLVCFSDELALGAIRALVDAGVRVPDDVAVVGIDDIEDGRFSVPRLTTIAPDKPAIAAAAVEAVLGRVASARADPVDIVIGHRLVVRESG